MYRLIMTALAVLGIVYVGLHIWVTYHSAIEAGWIAGVVTFLTLGFGDAYWAWAWWSRSDIPNEANAAFIATIMAFISWGTRPWFRPFLFRLATEHALRDRPDFMHDMHKSQPTANRPSAQGAKEHGHGGGAS